MLSTENRLIEIGGTKEKKMYHMKLMLLLVCAVATVSSLPIISPALENNPDHLVWEALLTIDTRYADQDKTRKIPKSIFITPNLNESKVTCMPGHKLGPDGKCYKTLNIDPLDILKTQIASLFGQNRNKTTTPVVDYDEEYDYSDYGDSTESINNKYEVPLSLSFADEHRPPKFPNKVVANDHKIILGDVVSDREPFHEQPFLVDPVDVANGHKHKHHTTTSATTASTSTTAATTEAVSTATAETDAATATATSPTPSSSAKSVSAVDDAARADTAAATTISSISSTSPRASVQSTTEPSYASTAISNDVRSSTVPTVGHSDKDVVASSTEPSPLPTLNVAQNAALMSTVASQSPLPQSSSSEASPTTESSDITTSTDSAPTEMPTEEFTQKSTEQATSETTTEAPPLSSTTKRLELTSEHTMADTLLASASSISSILAGKDGADDNDTDHDDADDYNDADDDEHPLSSENSVHAVFDPIDFINHIEITPLSQHSERMTHESNSVDIPMSFIESASTDATIATRKAAPSDVVESTGTESMAEPQPSSIPLIAMAMKADTSEPTKHDATLDTMLPMGGKTTATSTQTSTSTSVPSSTPASSEDAIPSRKVDTLPANAEVDFNTELHMQITSTAGTNKKSKIYEYITAGASSEPSTHKRQLESTSVTPTAMPSAIQSSVATPIHTTDSSFIMWNDATDGYATPENYSSDDGLDAEADPPTTPMADEPIEMIRRMDDFQDDDLDTGIGTDNDDVNLNARLIDESLFQGSNMMLAALSNLDNDTSAPNNSESDADPFASTITPDIITSDASGMPESEEDTVTDTMKHSTSTPSSSSLTLADLVLASNRTKHFGNRHDRTSSLDRTTSSVNDESTIPASTPQPSSPTATSTPVIPLSRGIGDKSDVNIKLGINCYLKNYLKHFYIMCT